MAESDDHIHSTNSTRPSRRAVRDRRRRVGITAAVLAASVVATVGSASPASAADNDLGGYRLFAPGLNGTVFALVGSNSVADYDTEVFSIAHLDAAGEPMESFGLVPIEPHLDSVTSMARSGAGVLLVGSESGRTVAVRLRRDGTVDTRYGDGGRRELSTATRVVTDVVADARGRLVVTSARGTAPNTRLTVQQYTPLGDPDPTFNGNGRRDVAWRVSGRTRTTVDPSSVTITFESPSGLSVARLSRGGSTDTAFGGDGLVRPAFPQGSSVELHSTAALPRGRTLVVGVRDEGVVGRQVSLLYVVRPNGRIDRTLGTNGLTVVDVAEVSYPGLIGFFRLANGSVMGVWGAGDASEVVTVRLRPTGALDSTYGQKTTQDATCRMGLGAFHTAALAGSGDRVAVGAWYYGDEEDLYRSCFVVVT